MTRNFLTAVWEALGRPSPPPSPDVIHKRLQATHERKVLEAMIHMREACARALDAEASTLRRNGVAGEPLAEDLDRLACQVRAIDPGKVLTATDKR